MWIFFAYKLVNWHVPNVPNTMYAHNIGIPNYVLIWFWIFETFQSLQLTNIVLCIRKLLFKVGLTP